MLPKSQKPAACPDSTFAGTGLVTVRRRRILLSVCWFLNLSAKLQRKNETEKRFYRINTQSVLMDTKKDCSSYMNYSL